jgi:hypothetical protein
MISYPNIADQENSSYKQVLTVISIMQQLFQSTDQHTK